MSQNDFELDGGRGAGIPPRSTFGAGRALLVLLAWLGGQLVGGFIGAVSGTIYLVSHGETLGDASALEEHMVELMTPALAVGTVVGAVAMLAAAMMLARPHLRQTDATGVGWARGPWLAILVSALIGIVISSLFVFAIVIMKPVIPEEDLGPVARLAEESERIRWIWAFIAVAIAPISEEFLFRGVLFSGLAKSWGVPAGAAIVSALFLLFHLAETLAFWPSMVAIGILTVGTITARLLTNRLGPPIAMHLGYNCVLAIALISGF